MREQDKAAKFKSEEFANLQNIVDKASFVCFDEVY